VPKACFAVYTAELAASDEAEAGTWFELAGAARVVGGRHWWPLFDHGPGVHA
jgi:hypothetical protein